MSLDGGPLGIDSGYSELNPPSALILGRPKHALHTDVSPPLGEVESVKGIAPTWSRLGQQ